MNSVTAAYTGNEIAAIIAASASLVAAIGSVIAVIGTVLNGRALTRQSIKIAEVHEATNGMTTELVRVTADANYAEGLKQGTENMKRPPTKG